MADLGTRRSEDRVPGEELLHPCDRCRGQPRPANGSRAWKRRRRYPEWSPGGRKIAYVAPIGDTDAGNVIVMNPDGRRKVEAAVSDGNVTCTMPAWSPDGERLAFRAVQAPDTANDVIPHLAYIQQYGGPVRDLSSVSASEPDWSPDGRRLAYNVVVRGRSTIRTLDLRRQRTTFVHTGSHPRWSPDGRRLVFADNGQIYTASANGSAVQQLTR